MQIITEVNRRPYPFLTPIWHKQCYFYIEYGVEKRYDLLCQNNITMMLSAILYADSIRKFRQFNYRLFTLLIESTYFFKGRRFWRFHDKRMSIFNDSGSIVQFWFGCYGHAYSRASVAAYLTVLLAALLPTVLNGVLFYESSTSRWLEVCL